ncbi:MAG: hypothetical protein JST79_09075 [Acidobacteria bacterium]|jgi:hypothetical protein|nr:hypothetical protein [Acidobacteriota bacterium]
MGHEIEPQIFLRKRLQSLGFTAGSRAHLYGEEFAFTSDPAPDGKGFSIMGVARKSGQLRNVPIPISIVRTIEQELHLMQHPKNAA